MKRRMISNFRQSRVLRLATSTALAGHLLSATPVLAQELTQATVKASVQAATDVTSVVERGAERTVRKSKRLVADTQRKLRKASMRVNRAVPKVTAPVLEPAFGVNVTSDMISRARVFEEPLIPVGEPTAEENRALGQLLQTIGSLSREQQAMRIDTFLKDHPASAWRASLQTTAAVLYAREGYYSRAASYWEQVWELTRGATDPGPRTIADYTLGQWLSQLTMFGQLDKLGTLLAVLEGRNVRGAAGVKVSVAREGVTLLSTNHDMATFSGPEALKSYLAVVPTRSPEDSRKTIVSYHPSVSGTTLTDLQHLSRTAGMDLEMVHLVAVGEIPVPSIVHLRSQHYSAIVGEKDGRYIVMDPGLGGQFLLTGAAIRDESTGYFLVSSAQRLTLGARAVPADEAASVLGHCAPGGPAHNDPPCPRCDNPGPGGSGGGMPKYTFHPQKISLLIDDVPLGYTPPVGPAMNFHLSYDHREVRHPQTIDYGNVGPMWSHNWLSYVSEPGHVTLRGPGQEHHLGLAVQVLTQATLTQVTNDPPRYERTLTDGTVEVFTLGDRPASHPGRRIFLTEVIDPQGHSVELTYDSSFRLVALTDAIGQVTTVDYLDSGHPLAITKVTDPFGRYATMTYDALGRLATITDAVGMTSSFAYGDGDFIAAMTTPYGTTTFRHEAAFQERQIEATDPAGGTERLEYRPSHSGLPTTVPSSEVPAGFTTYNANMHKYVVLYWDKLAMAAGPTLSNATITHLVIASTDFGGHAWARNLPYAIKRPLESRVWYEYPGMNAGHGLGNTPWPIKTARVLEGGASQVTQMTYNAKGRVTSRIDPVGRQTNYTYATNGLDLLQVEQVRSGGTDIIQQYSNYNSQHLPGTITDAAGQDTDITYNTAGQPLTVTNAKNETTTYTYETGTNNLLTVTGPVTGATTTNTYDAYGRLESVEDADGYVVITDYDHLNRLTQRTYPDDTTDTNTYSRLDLTEQKDRLGRVTRHFYDGFGRRIATRDPAGRTISQVWCDCGAMEALVDANGNRTRWERDVQGRVTREIRADNATDTLYTYDPSGRLKTITDPKDQVTTHSYNGDDSLSGTGYTNEVISTPDVSYTYDASYSRVATMVDGIGTTSYTYVAPGTNGAGQVATVDGPLSNDTIAYTYDELGRVIQRTINGSANQVDWTFDALGRVTIEENLLGEFTYTYHGVTNRLNTVTYPNSQTSTYSYLDAENDHRLQTIHHQYPSAATLSKFDYTYDAVGNILTWRQQADTTTVLWKYGYDPADQLIAAVKHATDTPETVLKRYAYAYDPAGNRTVEQIDDALTLSAYDQQNRLTSQAPGGPLVVAGSLNEPGTVTISGVPAAVDANNNFRGPVSTTSGTNTFTIVAKDASGNTTTKAYEVGVAGSSKTLTYDANGNLTSDGTRTFQWDAVNRLVEAQVSADAWQFTYDASGRRVTGSFATGGIPSIESTYLWCGFSPCEERDAATNAVARRLYGAGEAAGSAQRFVTSDHLQSARDVVLNGSVEGRAEFDPWGRATSVGSVNVATAYAGQQKHLGAPINLTMYRQYDAESGRWLSEDPAGAVDGPNLRAYTRNNPVRYSDPLGLCSCDDECPSGEWDVSYTSLTFGVGVGMDVGHGRIICRGKPEISRPARIGCVLRGAFVGVGVSGGTSFWTPAITGPCKRSDLQITRSTGWVGMTPLISVSGSDGAVTGISSSWGKWGAGFAFSDCMLTPM
jgi:RHS repeat-associated protein